MSDKVKVTIDGITVEVEPGTSILNAARQIGGDIYLLLCAIILNWKAVVENAGLVWLK